MAINCLEKNVDYFNYKNDELYCEDVKVADILKQVGSPAYIYSTKTFVEHLKKIQKAFESVDPLICYSMKANSNLAILKTMLNHGSGLDIVSGGELYRAKQVGCPPEKIVFAGVGKSEEEIEEAIRYGILFFNVESIPELELINKVAVRLNAKARVSLRVNPGVDPHTHHYIATGKAESKFGIDMELAKKAFENHAKYPGLSLSAIHCHIGSQITKGEPFVEAFKKVLVFIDEIEKGGITIEYLNLGGGLGVIYDNEKPQTAQEFAEKILPIFKGRKFRLVFEPGRFISANGGILVTKVLYVKQTKVKNFAIIDAAMNDLLRPSLYEAYHDVWLLKQKKEEAKKFVYDVVGPVCESGDVLARERHLPELKSEDLIALRSAGAYGFVMSSTYNSRPKLPEVLVKGDKFEIVRKRENYATLIEGETIPDFV